MAKQMTKGFSAKVHLAYAKLVFKKVKQDHVEGEPVWED